MYWKHVWSPIANWEISLIRYLKVKQFYNFDYNCKSLYFKKKDGQSRNTKQATNRPLVTVSQSWLFPPQTKVSVCVCVRYPQFTHVLSLFSRNRRGSHSTTTHRCTCAESSSDGQGKQVYYTGSNNFPILMVLFFARATHPAGEVQLLAQLLRGERGKLRERCFRLL